MRVLFDNLIRGLSLLPMVGISLAPDTYSEGGGGLLDDVDVTLLALKFRTSDGTPYDKPGSKSVPLLQIDMLPDGTQDVHTQYFSCGQLEQWAPSPDGETLIGMSDKTREPGASINRSCNAAIFLASLGAAGFPVSILADERVSHIAGTKCHVIRTKRKDNIKRGDGERTPEVLTVSRLIALPDGSAVGGAQSPAVTTAKQVAANTAPAQQHKYEPVASNGSFGDTDLALLAMQVLTNHGGPMKKMALMQEVHKAAASGAIDANAKAPNGQPARAWAPGRVFDDGFLGSQPYWRYDGGVVTLSQ